LVVFALECGRRPIFVRECSVASPAKTKEVIVVINMNTMSFRARMRRKCEESAQLHSSENLRGTFGRIALDSPHREFHAVLTGDSLRRFQGQAGHDDFDHLIRSARRGALAPNEGFFQ
jgi:hypothetical protein